MKTNPNPLSYWQRIVLLAQSYREPDEWPTAWRWPTDTWFQRRLALKQGEEKHELPTL